MRGGGRSQSIPLASAETHPGNRSKRSRLSEVKIVTSTVKERNGRNGGPRKTGAVRAEKSRVAAKGRRDKEQIELQNLAELLPINDEVLARVDKATLIRLCVCYIHTKEFTTGVLKSVTQKRKGTSLVPYNPEAPVTDTMKSEEGRLMMEALDGFLVFVGRNGRILFVSEQVEKHLGYSPVELMGLSALEFIHNEDHKEFERQFRDNRINKSEKQKTSSPSSMDFTDSDEANFIRDRQFHVRLKCHLVKPGAKTKQHGYLLTQWSGRLQCRASPSGEGSNVEGLVAIVRLIDTVPFVDIRLDGNVFKSVHDLSMRFTFCEQSILKLVGYYPDELMGKTAYQFHYPDDAIKIHNCHTNLIQKGTSVSKYYRFLGKGGEWIWMKTRATIVYNSEKKPQFVICLNSVYSEEEGRRCLLLEENEGTKAQGYIDLNTIGSKDKPVEANVTELNNKNNNETFESPSHSASTPQVLQDQQQLLPFTNYGQPSSVNSAPFLRAPTQLSPVRTEATLDHTYPVGCSGGGGGGGGAAFQPSGELPAGLAATGFPQFMQQNFTIDNTAFQFQETPVSQPTPTTSSSWLNELSLTQPVSEPNQTLVQTPPVPIPKANNMATTTTSMNSDYRLAVSDHDYSAKPDTLREKTNVLNFTSSLFSNLDNSMNGIDDVEMMDTDFLDTVSFGRTSYDDNNQAQNISLNGENLLGAILSKAGMNVTDDLDESSSLFEALGECQNGFNRSLLQSTGLSVTEFPSDMLTSSNSMDIYGTNANTASFASQFAESLIDEQVKDMTYSLGRTDPCMGVTSLELLAKSTAKSVGKKPGGGLNQNLNTHTLGLVDTPPPSPKPIRSAIGKVHPKPQNNHSRHHSSPATYTPPSCSPPLSAPSSATSIARSPTSPQNSFSLNKSWPNSNKSSRGRNNSTSSNGGGRHRNGGAGHSSRGSHGHRHVEHKHKQVTGSSLLEQFLTTKQRINPNKGSDNVFKESRVTERISKLQIGKDKTQQDDNNLLQQLLTGAIDDKQAHRYEKKKNGANKARRQSSETSTPPLTSPLVSDIESLTPDTPVLNLFENDPEAEMNSLLGSLSPEIIMHSDLDDILREESRQEALWHKEYLS